MTKAYPIIIDTDPGVDDTFAILYALAHPDLDVKALVSVSGNVSIESTTRNARGILGITGHQDIPVAMGSNTPLIEAPVFADYIHGAGGIGDHSYSDSDLAPLSDLNSIELYAQLLKEAETPVHIVALGPLTNLAILIRAYPELKDKIGQITTMGGSLGHGNVTTAAEFNYYVDPHAVKIVFESGIPLVMAGLHVTEMATLRQEDLEAIARDNKPLSDFLLKISKGNMDRMESMGYGRATIPHDLMTFMYLANPSVFEIDLMTVHVATEGDFKGMTFADTRPRYTGEGHVHVINQVDVEAYRRDFVETVKSQEINF